MKNLLWCIDEGCFIGNCFQKDVGVVILWFSIRLEALVTHRLAVVPLRKNTLIIRNIVRVRSMLPLGDTYWPLWDTLIYTLEFKEYSSIVVNTTGKEKRRRYERGHYENRYYILNRTFGIPVITWFC